MKTSGKKEIRAEFLRIADAAVLAAFLEASTEKPGNVTPTHSFKDTAYQDYVKGAIALGSAVRESAERGYLAGKGEIGMEDIGIGRPILKGVRDVRRSHKGGNTHLGMLMLMVPIAAASGMCIAEGKGFSSPRGKIKKVVHESTKEDSRNLCKAIKASRAGGIDTLIEKDLTFNELMKYSREKDRIAQELSGGMEILFRHGIPFFERSYAKKRDIRTALLQTYLFLLSRFPDTFIAKKEGMRKAREVSEKAKDTLSGKLSLAEFDKYLRSNGNSLNPGTTADLAAAVTMLYILKETVF